MPHARTTSRSGHQKVNLVVISWAAGDCCCSEAHASAGRGFQGPQEAFHKAVSLFCGSKSPTFADSMVTWRPRADGDWTTSRSGWHSQHTPPLQNPSSRL